MKKMQGFSLVELMVAVLILAVGLIGLAGLQVVGLRSNQTAYYRSIATQLAYDIADRIKANRAAVEGTTKYYNNGTASASKDCKTSACTPAEVAGYDLDYWNKELSSRLPEGKGIVCLPQNTTDKPVIGDSSSPTSLCGTAGQIYIIRVWWNDDRSSSSSATHTKQGFVTSFQP